MLTASIKISFHSLFIATITVEDCSPLFSTRWTGQMLLTNGQVVNHKRWMVRCSPLAPGFSLEQSTVRQHTPRTTPFHTLNLPHSEITANIPYTYRYNLPPPSFLDTNFVAERGNTPNCSEDSNQGFRGGRSISQPPCYH